MTDAERFDAIAKALMALRRENLRITARCKALEAHVAERVPKEEREQWYASLDTLTNQILQKYLESFEKESPFFAARLDDRGPNELKGLES